MNDLWPLYYNDKSEKTSNFLPTMQSDFIIQKPYTKV